MDVPFVHENIHQFLFQVQFSTFYVLQANRRLFVRFLSLSPSPSLLFPSPLWLLASRTRKTWKKTIGQIMCPNCALFSSASKTESVIYDANLRISLLFVCLFAYTHFITHFSLSTNKFCVNPSEKEFTLSWNWTIGDLVWCLKVEWCQIMRRQKEFSMVIGYQWRMENADHIAAFLLQMASADRWSCNVVTFHSALFQFCAHLFAFFCFRSNNSNQNTSKCLFYFSRLAIHWMFLLHSKNGQRMERRPTDGAKKAKVTVVNIHFICITNELSLRSQRHIYNRSEGKHVRKKDCDFQSQESMVSTEI